MLLSGVNEIDVRGVECSRYMSRQELGVLWANTQLNITEIDNF